MQIYILSFCFIMAFGIICMLLAPKKYKILLDYIFVGVTFLLLWFLASFRLDIGHDYSMYIESFFRMGRDSFSNLTYKDWEIGFILLTKTIVFFTKNQTFFLMITSAISLAGPAYLIMRYSKNSLMSVALYLNLFFYYITFNFIRQAIAISIVCFAWTFLRKNKFIPYMLIIVLASLFHMTALIMIVVYFLVKFKPGIRTLLFYAYLLLFYYILSDGLLNILLSRIHTEYENSVFITNGVSFVYALLPVFICLLLVLSYRFIDNLSLDGRYLISLVLFATFWLLIMTKHALFERFSYYSYIFVILAVPKVLASFSKWLPGKLTERLLAKPNPDSHIDPEIHSIYCSKCARRQAKIIINIAFWGIILLSTCYHFYGLSVGTSGVHGVVPYKSILDFLNL